MIARRRPHIVVHGLIVMVFFLLQFSTNGFCDVSVGVYVHSSRRFVVFVGENTDAMDKQCRFSVWAVYVDADKNEVGLREIPKTMVIKGGGLKFEEEAGREMIATLEAQAVKSPSILRVQAPNKNCEDEIDFSTPNFKYRGEMKGGLLHGRGKRTFSNGTEEEGTYSEGKREGYFEITYSNKVLFSGTYANDVRVRGVETYTNGAKYEGEFTAGNLRDGKGVMRNADGSRFEGSYTAGKAQGYGRYFSKTGNLVFEGEYKDGKRNGRGTEYRENGDKFVGNFVDGTWSGSGTFYESGGTRWEASWVNGQLDGYAVQYRPGGELWKGKYSRGNLLGGGVVNGKHSGTSSILKVCNNRNMEIWLAVGYKRYGTWYASGWWSAEYGKCKSIAIYGDDRSSVYLLFSTAANASSRSWLPSSASQPKFCVDSVDFLLTDQACDQDWGKDMDYIKFGEVLNWWDRSQPFTYNF